MVTALAAAGIGVVFLFGLMLFAALGVVAFVMFNGRPKALPAYRWRALQRDADKKFEAKQLQDDYRTLIEQAGYEVTEAA